MSKSAKVICKMYQCHLQYQTQLMREISQQHFCFKTISQLKGKLFLKFVVYDRGNKTWVGT